MFKKKDAYFNDIEKDKHGNLKANQKILANYSMKTISSKSTKNSPLSLEFWAKVPAKPFSPNNPEDVIRFRFPPVTITSHSQSEQKLMQRERERG